MAIGLAFGFIISTPAAADENSRASNAAQQLLRAQTPSGQFDFEYDFLLGGNRPKTRIGNGKVEVITREAGAAYGLSSYFLRDNDEKVHRALAAILLNLEKLSLPIAKALVMNLPITVGIGM